MGNGERSNLLNMFRASNGISKTDLVDQFGRVVEKGDLVILPNQPAVIWRVAEVTPELHPEAMAGSLRLGLVSVQTLAVQGGAPTLGLIKVQDGKVEAAQAGQAPPADPAGKVSLQ